MNISRTSAAPSADSQLPVADAAQILVLKKAMNLQAASAAKLLDSLPQAAPALATDGSVGRNVDTFA